MPRVWPFKAAVHRASENGILKMKMSLGKYLFLTGSDISTC